MKLENLQGVEVLTLNEQISFNGGEQGDALKYLFWAYGYIVGTAVEAVVEAVQEYKEGFNEGYNSTSN